MSTSIVNKGTHAILKDESSKSTSFVDRCKVTRHPNESLDDNVIFNAFDRFVL